jgi:hypothetical protein
VTDLSRIMASNTTSRFRSIAPNLGAFLFKRPETPVHNSNCACADEKNAFSE